MRDFVLRALQQDPGVRSARPVGDDKIKLDLWDDDIGVLLEIVVV